MTARKALAITVPLSLIALVLWIVGEQHSDKRSPSDLSVAQQSTSHVPAGLNETPESSDTKEGNLTDLQDRFRKVRTSELPYDQMRIERARLLSAIAARYGFDAAMSALREEVGPGDERDTLVAVIFKSIDEPITTSLKRLDASELPEDDAIQGILERAFRQQLSSEQIGLVLAHPDAQKHLDTVGALIGVELINAGDRKAASSIIANLCAAAKELQGEAGSKILTLLAQAGAQNFPFETWAALETAGWRESGSENATVRKYALNLFRAMVLQDPRKAMELASGSGESLNGEITIGFEQWLKLDQFAAEKWLAETTSTLSSKAKDEASEGKTKFLTQKGKIEDAKAIVEKIVDPEARKRAAGIVWTAERDKLRKEVDKNPAGTLNSIIAGGGAYEDYWIEEAMFNWASKDLNKAVAWYEKNWDSLSPSKAQYVAAAFATQSLQGKDIDTARQWAALIQDAKTKARIEADIAKAATK